MTAEEMLEQRRERWKRESNDLADLWYCLPQLMRDYHEARLHEALKAMLNNTSPVGEEEMERLRLRYHSDDIRDLGAWSIEEAKRVLADRDHYRDLCVMLTRDDAEGVAEAYRRGMAAGIAEGVRQAVAVAEKVEDDDGLHERPHASAVTGARYVVRAIQRLLEPDAVSVEP